MKVCRNRLHEKLNLGRCIECRRLSDMRYNRSEKAAKKNRRYQESEKGQERQRRYRGRWRRTSEYKAKKSRIDRIYADRKRMACGQYDFKSAIIGALNE